MKWTDRRKLHARGRVVSMPIAQWPVLLLLVASSEQLTLNGHPLRFSAGKHTIPLSCHPIHSISVASHFVNPWSSAALAAHLQLQPRSMASRHRDRATRIGNSASIPALVWSPAACRTSSEMKFQRKELEAVSEDPSSEADNSAVIRT